MKRLLALALLAPLALAGCLQQGAPLAQGVVADDEVVPPKPEWARLEDATIRPGVAIRTPSGECASNFMFIRPDNTSVYLGTTAYCMRDVPIGALVTVGGPENLAILAYSSWITMEENGESDPDAREYNDFAVIRLDASTRPRAHPAMLVAGGPTGAADAAAVASGDRVRAFTNATTLLAPETAWHDAIITGRVGDWALLAHAAPPGTPGALGGGVVTPDGRALGVMVNLGVAPNPGSNGVARLDALMAYAKEHARLDMQLATWETFAPGPLDQGLVSQSGTGALAKV